MAKTNFAAVFLIVFITAGFFKVAEIEAESTNGKFFLEPSWNFNPFNMNSWVSIPSQFTQFWFPLFRPAYYPSYLPKPGTTKPTTAGKNQTLPLPSKQKTENIFGVSGPADENVEYLPPQNEIEW